ncbi:T9SS type A sorting domain-containing protein [Hymenobacter sp. BT188]|uniref:DUF4961 domain-containing protein n=1 Tax=Hymenobacter sp. BT188 TaxID=2763504 RepID=UPI001650D8A0|nr:alpha-amylase family glycosyl hydrolase [Hymenobacter sp. BT188]MBC6607675.1 T9SS type A sorting domain-containing protein [Hymenobacter sp. BT188]
MKTLRLLFSLFVLLTGLPAAYGQVTTQPAVFLASESVTITFNATQGNGELANFTGDVYIWTGVITSGPTGSTWTNVKSPAFNQPDAAAKMTRSATNSNIYTITFTPNTFYPITPGTTIYRLGMIFKNADGSKVGRGPSGDIFIDVAQDRFNLRFTAPTGPGSNFFVLNTPTTVTGNSIAPATLALFLNGVQLGASEPNATTITRTVTLTAPGANTIRLTATDANGTAETLLTAQSREAVAVAQLPVGAKKDGVTYLNGGSSAILSLTAPNKQFVYAIGDFNDWQPTTASAMKRTPVSASDNAPDNSSTGRWWIQLDNLTPGREYTYQYLVDGALRIADPYTQKVLDPNNDQTIPAVTYPAALLQYPTGKTTGIVSTFQSGQAEYQWQVANFQKPKRTDLVVYELLVRDFIARHDYKTLTDTLSYLQRLGVNAIELMPINEFEGNESWGYNPSFYFTPDKYYGTKDDLKRFVDECHKRGMAVIIDMVLNHSFGQSPMVQMYFENGAPTAQSPWFNRAATHPFNVGYDFNHESPFTKYFVERVNEFWLQEYHIDGYRYDLSKGFTQRNNPNDVGAWGRRDDSRIAIWKNIYDQIRAIDPNVYCILEHLSDNDEEKILADYGMMLWGNQNGSYANAVRGQSSGTDFSGGYYANRGWQQPNLITYMESHDEERLMVRAVNEGNQSGAAPGYNVRDVNTALSRMGQAAAFFFTVPGPKMVWQFGELGYDVGINFNGRVGNKPIRWEYQQDPARRNLYNVYRSLIELKKTQSVFESPATYTQSLSGTTKSIRLANADLSVTIIGNFDVVSRTVAPGFQSAGTWYNYLSDATLTVSAAELNTPITLAPGEYRVYTSQKVNRPQGVVLSAKRKQDVVLNLTAAPNPAAATATLRYELKTAAPVAVTITNLLGATVRTLPATPRQAVGSHELPVSVAGLANGVYLVRLSTGEQIQTTRLVVQH